MLVAGSQDLARKPSFSNLIIKPNYYMKSLEYYYPLNNSEYFTKIYKEHFTHSFSSMKFVRMLRDSREEADAFVEQNKQNLKRRIYYNDKKTIVFDLDETLAHCSEGLDLGDTNIAINFPNGTELGVDRL